MSDVEKTKSVVHGVLYTLSEQDFVKVGRTEGVPWGYRWQKCEVYPYVGDGETAGWDAVHNPQSLPIEAYTLVPPNTKRMTEVPPSSSYLGLIQQGAELWKFDRAYRDQLSRVKAATNLIISDGISELALRVAERASGIDRNHKIGIGK